MTLPELDLQFVYGRLGWALVLLALLTSWRIKVAPTRLLALFALLVVVNWLPGQASPAYWLILAFQYPSALLVACCLLRLLERARNIRFSRALPRPLALVVVVVGALLYLDTFGLFARGLYHAGFNGYIAPALALATALTCMAVIARAPAARLGGPAGTVLLAIALFSALRLPSGNLFDALVDPLLFIWALGVVLASFAPQRAASAPATHEASLGAQPLAAEPVSSMKESIGGK